MIAVAPEAERRACAGAHAGEVDVAGRRLVVGNGYARERQITTATGRVEVRRPVAATGSGLLRRSCPACMRRSPKVTEVLPVLYVRGFVDRRLRAGAGGLLRLRRGPVGLDVPRLTGGVARRASALVAAGLAQGPDYVYVLGRGVYTGVRLPNADGHADRLYLLLIVGVRTDGSKVRRCGRRELRDTGSWLGYVLRGLAAADLPRHEQRP